MKRALISVVLIVFVFGCAGAQLGADTPEQGYLKARMTFNGLLSDYVEDKRKADAETRARWTETIDPWFNKGATALKLWGTALKGGASTYTQQQAYLDVKNQILDMLLTEFTE